MQGERVSWDFAIEAHTSYTLKVERFTLSHSFRGFSLLDPML